MATKLLLVLSVFTIYTIEWVEKGLFSKSQLIFICEKSLKSSKIEIFKFLNFIIYNHYLKNYLRVIIVGLRFEYKFLFFRESYERILILRNSILFINPFTLLFKWTSNLKIHQDYNLR
jgi:hypothetical protein